MEANKIKVGDELALKTRSYMGPERVTVVAVKVVAATKSYGSRGSNAEIAELNGLDRVDNIIFRGPNAVAVTNERGNLLIVGPRHLVSTWEEAEVALKQEEERRIAVADRKARRAAAGVVFANDEAPDLVEALVDAGIAIAMTGAYGSGAKGVTINHIYGDGSGDNSVTLDREVVLALTAALHGLRGTAAA